MKYKFLSIIFFLFLISLTASKCKKDKMPTNPVDQLPPATQTGANTLGFLLNDQVWTPKGFSGGTTNLSIYYDRSYHEGSFNITTYRQLSQDDKQSFAIAMDSLKQVGSYNADKTSNLKFSFIDQIKNCQIDYFDTSIFRKGKLTISKIDTINQIISGMFEIALFNIACGDPLKITEGRFDMKY